MSAELYQQFTTDWPAIMQLKKLADDAFQVSARTRSLYHEIGKVHRRLGTKAERPGDLDRIRRSTEELSRALAAAALYRSLGHGARA